MSLWAAVKFSHVRILLSLVKPPPKVWKWPSLNVTETCYLVKHIERNGRDSCQNPWSIRQIGIYHKRNSQKDEDVFISLNPSDSFSGRLRAIHKDGNSSVKWEGIHILALASTSRQWGAYFNEVDEKINELVSVCCSKGPEH